MSKLLSRIFPLDNKSDRAPKQGNGIAIFCGIVSVITCCYSCNIAYSRYEDAREQYIQSTKLIEEAGADVIRQTSDRRKEALNASSQRSPFI